MRHIVYLLLMANILYLGWNLFQSQREADRVQALPSLPADVRPLVTLEEYRQGEALPQDAAGIEKLTDARPPGALPEAGCTAIGPFDGLATVQAAGNRLHDGGLAPEMQTIGRRVENGFWVFVPGAGKQHARDVVQQLEELGDEDHFVGRDYLVSLGAFRNIARAEARLAAVRDMGFDAVLEQRYKTKEDYWLELPGDLTGSSVLEWLKPKYPGVQIISQPCM